MKATKANATHYFFVSLVICLVACAAAIAAEEKKAGTDDWVNISDNPASKQGSSEGIAVDPTTGNLYLYTLDGLHISKDQGASWSAIPSPIKGASVSGSSFNIAYPFTGRMAIFTRNGSGGMTLDGGKTWQEIGSPAYFGDVDWSSPKPGLLMRTNINSPTSYKQFVNAISTDAGKTWADVGAENPDDKLGHAHCVGVADARTVLQGSILAEGISISRDLGATWTKTADFRPSGHRPVHYGSRLYWIAKQGLMMSENGSDWKQVGTAPPGCAGWGWAWGPYFGASENEMMLVAMPGFFISTDAAKTWKKVADYPHSFMHPHANDRTLQGYFAWDPLHNNVYASMEGKGTPKEPRGLWRLQVK